MFLIFVTLFSLSLFTLSAMELTPEQLAFSEKIAGVLQLGSASEYRKLIHSKCPVDEAKILDVAKSPWTKKYQVRAKAVAESFDPAKIQFKVQPEYVLEFQVWTKVTNPQLLKMMKGSTEVESIKSFPIAKENSQLKILEWPCFNSIQ